MMSFIFLHPLSIFDLVKKRFLHCLLYIFATLLFTDSTENEHRSASNPCNKKDVIV